MSNVTSPRCSLSPELVSTSIALDPGVQWLLCETAAARRETAPGWGVRMAGLAGIWSFLIFCLVKKLDTKTCLMNECFSCNMHIAEVCRVQFQLIEFVIYMHLFTYIVCLKSCISKHNICQLLMSQCQKHGHWSFGRVNQTASFGGPAKYHVKYTFDCVIFIDFLIPNPLTNLDPDST